MKKLNVVYSSDENYSKLVMTSMVSLLENNTQFDKINVYVISNGISQQSKELTVSLAEGTNAEVIFIDFAQIEDKIYTDGNYSVSSYARLFLTQIIDEDYVIYMDCDSIVTGSLMPLVEEDFDDYAVGGVLDIVNPFFKTALGLDEKSEYFNAGFLYINLDYWRKNDIENQMTNYLIQCGGSVPHHDQGCINAVLKGKIKRISPRYNLQCPMFEFTPRELKKIEPAFYDKQELDDAKNNPVFIHYTNGFYNRPWFRECSHPMVEDYRKYMKKVPDNSELKDIPLHKKAKLMRFIYNHFPFPIFNLYNSILTKRKAFILNRSYKKADKA